MAILHLTIRGRHEHMLNFSVRMESREHEVQIRNHFGNTAPGAGPNGRQTSKEEFAITEECYDNDSDENSVVKTN